MLQRPLQRSGRAATIVVLALLGLALVLGLWWFLGRVEPGSASQVAGVEGSLPSLAGSASEASVGPEEGVARVDSAAPKVERDGFVVQPYVRLSGPGVLVGRVLERSSGAPVEGAAVELLPLPPVGQEFFGRALRLAKTGAAFASRVESIAVAASASDGAFEFSGIRCGNYYIQARGATFVPDNVVRAVVAASGEGGPVDVFVRRGGRILGRVVQPGGKPLSGAKVIVTLGPGNVIESLRSGDMCYAEATSDEYGQFVLSGIPASEGYDVTAVASGVALSHALDVAVRAGQDTTVLIETRFGGRVEGRVVTKRGDDGESSAGVRALAGAHVAVVPRGLRDLQFAEELLEQSHTVSGPDGRFRIENVPPGEFDLVGVAERHVPAKGPRFLSAEGALAQAGDFELPTGPMVSGRVLDSAGQGIEGVSVRWNSVDFRNFDFDFSFAPLLAGAVKGFDFPKTDAEGRFTAGAFAGDAPYRVQFFKMGYENGEHRWDPVSEKDGFEVVLQRGGAIEGIVMDASRKTPVTTFTIETDDRVETQADAPGNMNPFSGGLRVEHPQGKFRVDPVKSGGKVELVFRAHGFLEKRVADLQVAEGQVKRGVIVELAPGGSVVGRVSDLEGQPVAGAQVFAVPASQSSSFERRRGRRGPPELEQMPPGFRDFAAQMGLLGDRCVVSKADGAFELVGLEPGSTVVLASHRDYVIGKSAPVLVAPGAPQEVEIELFNGGGVQGRCLDRFGRPVVGSIVIAVSPANFAGEGRANGGGIYQARTSSDGAYKITRMVGGGYFVVLTRGDEALNPMSFLGTLNFDMVTVPEDEIVEYDIVDTSSGATRVYGQVLDRGAPVGRGNITALSFESESMLGVDLKLAQIKEQGRYEFAGLAPGEYQFNVDAPGDGRAGVRITADIPDVPEFQLDLRYPEGAIEGTVVSAADRAPAANAEVSVRLVGGPESSGWLGQMIARESGVRRVRTNAAGEYAIDGLGAGKYSLSVRPSRDEGAPRLANSPPIEVEVRENQVERGVDIELSAAIELEGRVVSAEGEAIADAIVLARPSGAAESVPERATTNDQGLFRFAALATGTYELSANADGYADGLLEKVLVDGPRSEPLEVVLQKGIEVRIKVVGATGQALSGATGRLTPKGRAATVAGNDIGRAFNNIFSGKGVSDSKGLLELGTFGPGEYTLQVQRGTERAEETVVLGGPGPVELRVRLK
ncbi:MAG: carboxypeptidase regulatory-like domain-containing protein [Planctomycetes bacterium]|nr:carboxypeptidase regulatory-like domain-containing protein [Planctomycetota bacterium]